MPSILELHRSGVSRRGAGDVAVRCRTWSLGQPLAGRSRRLAGVRRGPLAAIAVRSACSALLAAVLLAGAATGAAAAPTWLAPFDALPQPATFMQPVMNAGGEILFADRADVGGGKFAFRVAAREPAGGVAAPALFPPAGSTTLSPISSLALADDGHAILAWYDDGVAFYALRAPDGTWGAPIALSGSAKVTGVVAGVDGSGRATLAWAENTNPSAGPADPNPNTGTVKVVRISASGTVSGSQTLLSPAASLIATVGPLRVTGSGAAMLLYGTTTIFLFGDQSIAFRDAPTGSFGNATDLGASPLFGSSADMNDSGRAAYAQASGAADIALRVREPGGALAPVTNVGAGGSASNTHVGLAGDGTITVAWDIQIGGDPRVMACTIAGGDCAGDPQRLSAPTNGGVIALASLAVNAAGAALAAWNDLEVNPAGAWHAKAAWRPAGPGAAFGPEHDLAPPPAQSPAVALDADGDGIATYHAATAGTTDYRAVGLDAAGPRIGTFSAPAPASVAQGAGAAFSAGASDLWSPFGFSWSFGDGSAGAAGGAVTHAFAAAGAFRVTATATDAAGNSSSRSAVVLVRDTVSPRVERLALTHARFRVGAQRTATAAGASTAAAKKRRHPRRPRTPSGTTVRYAVSEAAVATFAIDRAVAGRRVGRTCRKATRANRRHRRCTRYVHAGTLTRHARAGADSLAFSGRIGRKALAPGSYRLTLTLRDPAGNASRPKSLTFTIVR
jgi:PKD domain